jgi:hypothetical protein
VRAEAPLKFRSDTTTNNFNENSRLRRADFAPLASVHHSARAWRNVLETNGDGSPQESSGLES